MRCPRAQPRAPLALTARLADSRPRLSAAAVSQERVLMYGLMVACVLVHSINPIEVWSSDAAAVAGGARTVAAIRGALRGGYLDVLITDRFTAARLAE